MRLGKGHGPEVTTVGSSQGSPWCSPVPQRRRRTLAETLQDGSKMPLETAPIASGSPPSEQSNPVRLGSLQWLCIEALPVEIRPSCRGTATPQTLRRQSTDSS